MRDAQHTYTVVSNAQLASSSLQEPRRARGVYRLDRERERQRFASAGNRRVVIDGKWKDTDEKWHPSSSSRFYSKKKKKRDLEIEES